MANNGWHKDGSQVALVLSCPLQRDGQIWLKTDADYAAISRFLRETCEVAIHPSSTHNSQLGQAECLRSLASFFASHHDLFIVAIQGEGREDGTWELADGKTLSCQDLLQVFIARERLGLKPALLFVLLDFCHSGAWANFCAKMSAKRVVMQVACSAVGKTIDSYDKSFTKVWVEVQLERPSSPLRKLPGRSRLPLERPRYYIADGTKLPALCGKQVLLFGEECSSDHVSFAGDSTIHRMLKVDGSEFLKDRSKQFYLHWDVVAFMKSLHCESLHHSQDAVRRLQEEGKMSSIEDGLLFNLQASYLFRRLGREEEMWETLDNTINAARAIGTARAVAALALALSWKSYYACVGLLQVRKQHHVHERALKAMSEMLSLYDRTSLSNPVCASIMMCLGVWNQWHATQHGGEQKIRHLQQAEHHILTSLTLAGCREGELLDEHANDVIKYQRIQLEVRYQRRQHSVQSAGQVVFGHEHVKHALVSMRHHLQTMQHRGLQRLSERSSIRCLAACIEVCAPSPGLGYRLSSLICGQVAPSALMYHYYICHPRFQGGARTDQTGEEMKALMEEHVGSRVMFFLSPESLPSLEPFMYCSPFLSKFDAISV